MKAKSAILILFVMCTGMLPARQPESYETEIYKERIALFKSESLRQNQIVFLGNSLTQGGRWEEYFPVQMPANRGITGDNTEGILARLDEIITAKPDKLFMLMGINDISQNYNNDYICSNIKKIINRIQAESPETRIYIQSILPINNNFGRYKKLINKEKQIEQLNKLLKKTCKKEKVKFINLYPRFLQKKRTLNSKYTPDGLHLNESGYEVWVKTIQKLIEE